MIDIETAMQLLMRSPRTLSKRLRKRRRRLMALHARRQPPFTQEALDRYCNEGLAAAIAQVLRGGRFEDPAS